MYLATCVEGEGEGGGGGGGIGCQHPLKDTTRK